MLKGDCRSCCPRAAATAHQRRTGLTADLDDLSDLTVRRCKYNCSGLCLYTAVVIAVGPAVGRFGQQAIAASCCSELVEKGG